MKEGFFQQSEPAGGEQEAQRVSIEIMNLIHAGNFDAATEKINSIQDEGRREQLKTLLSMRKMHKKGEKQKTNKKYAQTAEDVHKKPDLVEKIEVADEEEKARQKEMAEQILDDFREVARKKYEESSLHLKSLQDRLANTKPAEQLDKEQAEDFKQVVVLSENIQGLAEAVEARGGDFSIFKRKVSAEEVKNALLALPERFEEAKKENPQNPMETIFSGFIKFIPTEGGLRKKAMELLERDDKKEDSVVSEPVNEHIETSVPDAPAQEKLNETQPIDLNETQPVPLLAKEEGFVRPEDIQEFKRELGVAVDVDKRMPAEGEHDGLTEKLPTEKEPEKIVEELLKTVPSKEKPAWTRRIIGAGFGIQQAKNWAGEQAFGFAYKKFFESATEVRKENQRVAEKKRQDNAKQGIVEVVKEKELTVTEKVRFETGLLIRSIAQHYSEAKEESAKNKEDFYAGKSKKKAWMQLAGEGVRAIRGVFAPLGMLRSPVWLLMGVTRISETAKEMRFEKKKYDVTSDEAAEEAMTMYGEAEKEAKAAGREAPTADDISRVYAKGVVRGTLEAGTGALTKMTAGLGVKKLIEPLYKEIQEVEGDATLSVEEKQTRLNELARKNEKLIKEVDLLVDRAGNVDAVAYNLRQAGVWSKRIAAAVAIESVLELGFHGLTNAFSSGAEVSHSDNVEVSSMKRPFVASMARRLEQMGETKGLDLSGVEAPEDVPEPVVIAEGGNIWSSAKEAAESAGLSKSQFAEAWGNSHATLPDGREIPIAELNLVHAGDTLSYVPGENGEVGHFEFNNESKITYGDALNLPGAQEPEVISKIDFEPGGFMETVDVTAPEIATIPSGDLPEAEGITADSDTILLREIPPQTAGGSERVDMLEKIGIEKYSADIADKELRWFFGEKYEGSAAWKDIRQMSARKFEKMSVDDGGKEGALAKFQSYIGELEKKTGIRPRGGLFRRDETVLEYFSRVRRALIEQRAAGK